CQDTSNLKLTF
nr:immunoglobulin light chain junction region [Macaca mulatta]